MLLLLLACKGDPIDSDSSADTDPWCRALQGDAYGQFNALPAGDNGPEIYEPWIHQSITLTPQGGALYTGSLRFTPPEAGTYVLAFAGSVDVLFRGPENIAGTDLEPSCAEVAQIQGFELDSIGYHLQLSDVSSETLSMVTGVIRTVDPAGAKNLGPLGRRETEGVRQPVERRGTQPAGSGASASRLNRSDHVSSSAPE